MTHAEQIAWLRQDHHKRVVLVEQDYMYQVGVSALAVPTLGTLYFSNFAYTDEDTDPPTRYQAVLKEAAEYERSLDRKTLRGKYNVDVGATVINNADGEFDYLLDLAIDGSEQRIYVGDPTWVRSDFIHLFSALSVKAKAQKKKLVTIELRDPALLLNKSIGGTMVVGGTGPNANKYRPLIFGFVHQIQPPLEDVATSKYDFADTGLNTSVVAVRNDGVNIMGITTDNGDGSFQLSAPPTANETITCDAVATAGSAFAYRASDAFDFFIRDRAGLGALGRYTGAGAMFEWNAFNDYYVGMLVSEKKNCVEIANELCDTINGFWAFTRLGSFYYSWMRPEALSVFLVDGSDGLAVPISAEITKDDIRGEMAIDHNVPSYASYQGTGNFNWFNQTTFSSSLDAEDREQYTRDGYVSPWYFGEEPGATAYRGDVASWQGGAPEKYHLSLSDSQSAKTLISGPTDGSIIDVGATYPLSVDDCLSNWASVRRSKNLPWVEFVDETVGLDLFELEIGDIVRQTHPRHGMVGGKLLQVCKIRIKPMTAEVDLGLTRRRFADVAVAPNTGGFLLQESGYKIILV